jgi:hypothetical protein
MSSRATRQAVWPANTYGEKPEHMDGSRVVEFTGSRKVEVPDAASYRPPEGWRIDAINHGRFGCSVIVERDGDE